MSGDKTLRDIWSEYWEDYYEQPGNSRRVEEVAREYPVKRGLYVSYTDLLDRGITHKYFKTHPDEVLGVGIETFEEFVREADIEDSWDRGYDAMILHLEDLPDGFKVWDYSHLEDHLNELIQVTVTVDSDPVNKSDMMEGAFECVNGHVTRIHQSGLYLQDIDTCPECGESVYLEPRKSLFTRVQRATVAGEGFSDVMVIIGGSRSIRDEMQKGDRLTLNAIPRGHVDEGVTQGDVYMGVLNVTDPEE